MNILIAYTTKSGVTKECAEQLGSLFSAHAVTLVDLANDEPELDAYDLVAIGAPVRYGRMDKRAVQFVKRNGEALKAKKFGLFCCCGFPDAAEECFLRSYPRELLDASVANTAFGGEMDPARVRGFDCFIVKIVLRNIDNNNRNEDRDRDIALPALLPEHIRTFADKLRDSLS